MKNVSQVFDTSATECETIKNFKFDQIPLLLKNSSVTNPLVITSVRKSNVCD